jgi:ribosomal protein S18 acetylase RimI-like enzyme
VRVQSFTPPLLRSLQERAARAQPVEHVAYDGGWWLRRTASTSWWLGAVLPHGEPDDLLARVERAERAYAADGRAASFQISPGVCPDGLDALLEARGYRRDGRISLQCAAAADVRAAPGPGLESRVDDRADDAWFDLWHRVHGHGAPGPDRANLDRLAHPAGYVTVFSAGRVIAVGRAVAESGWTGLFGLATLPEARGRGAGRELLRALAAWAREQGTPNLYLQVESRNAPANALYATSGFTEVMAYHYRARS